MYLPLEKYKKIISTMPVLCTDIIIKNPEKKFLLVKRNNEPLKSLYWVPGGRIFHYEDINDALNRILLKEVNINAIILDKYFIGVYQDFFNENSFETNTKYHTVSLVFEINLHSDIHIALDSQSEDYIWSDILPQRFLNKIIK